MHYAKWPCLFLLVVLTACAHQPGKQDAVQAGKKESLLRIARASRDAGDTDAALRIYQRVIPYAGGDTVPQQEMAAMLMHAGRLLEAEKMLRETIEKHPEDTELLRRLAEVYLRRDRLPNAIATYDRALAIDSKDTRLYGGKGVALDLQTKHDDARRVYREGLKIAPADISLLTNLAVSFILTKEYDEAIALLVPVVNGPDTAAEARQNLALAYGLKGDMQAARELGLEDLERADVEENVAFYKMMLQAK